MFLDDLTAMIAGAARRVRNGRTILPPYLDGRRKELLAHGIDPMNAAVGQIDDMRGPATLRLVLSHSALDTIDETCSSPTLVAAARRSVVLPQAWLWCEWRMNGQTCGVAFRSRPGAERVAGNGATLIRAENGAIYAGAFDFDLRGAEFIRWSSATTLADNRKVAWALERLVTGLSALWASPRLIEVENVQTPPRLAAARAKRRAPALSDYSVVHLSKVAAAVRDEPTLAPGDRTRPRGHRVRGHLRLLGSGRVVPVRPHERGDRDRPMTGTVRVVG